MKGDREEQKWPLVDTKVWVRGSVNLNVQKR